MRNFLFRWLVNIAGIVIVARIVPGISLAGYKAAVLAALILGLLNTFIKPVLLIITLPVNILSLGLFTLFINTFVFYLASELVSGFVVSGFWSAFLGALGVSLAGILLNIFAGPSKFEMKADFRGGSANPSHRDAIDIEVVPPEDKDKKLLSK